MRLLRVGQGDQGLLAGANQRDVNGPGLGQEGQDPVDVLVELRREGYRDLGRKAGRETT
jgi:hypothetical protein